MGRFGNTATATASSARSTGDRVRGFSGRGTAAASGAACPLLVHGATALDLVAAFDRFAHGELVIELNVV
ncbi:MAG: hypothetical protein IPG84_08925 [Betaproteobacteria bacterium]|nr:hypothetical protein [Betaproteobacteria bacterium]